LTASIGLLVVMSATGTGTEVLARYPEPRLWSIAKDYASHLLMLHGLQPQYDQGAGNPPLWTLAREEYLYLMYPLLLLLRKRMPWYTLAAVLGALSVALQYGLASLPADGDTIWLITYSAPALWIQWQLGVVAADAYQGEITLPAFWRQARWIPMWLLLGYLMKPGTIFLGLAFFTAVNAGARLEVEGRWPSTGIVGALSRLGLWSYSLYLIHFPVQTIALALSRRVVPEVGVAGFILRALLLTVVSVIAGRVLFVLVERHFVTLPRRAESQPLAAAAPSLSS
jgi:peptidoglycan/LPS O-acetylase OafA/YrhL